MVANSERTLFIEGKHYWTVAQFAKLTHKSEQNIRLLIIKGNRLRKLKADRFGGKPFICEEELTEFPFVVNGRPSSLGILVEKFFIDEEGNVSSKEEKFEPCQ